MKKLYALLGVAAAVAIGSFVWLMMSYSSLIKSGIETFGPKLTGGPVTIQSVKISPLSGKGSIKGLVIGNPKGFQTDSAFELAEVRLAVRPRSLLSDVIVIDEIFVKGAKVTYEMAQGGSNVAALQRNIEAFAGGPSTPAPEKKEEAAKPAGPEKKVRIKSFAFIEGQSRVSAKILRGKAVTVPLPEIRLKDIGGKDGTTPGKAAAAIFKALTSSIASTGQAAVKQAAAQITDGVKKAADQAKSAVKGIKGLFGK